MRTKQEVAAIIAELCSRVALLFSQSRIEAILFGSYARGDAGFCQAGYESGGLCFRK